jgi:plasmid maintenance system antidote protein VapI
MTSKIDDLMKDGEAVAGEFLKGASVSEIARERKVHRHVVTQVLAEQGIRPSERSKARDQVLQRVRSGTGVTRTQLAEEFGLHPNTVAEYLRGTEEQAMIIREREAHRRYSDAQVVGALREAWKSVPVDRKRFGLSRAQYDAIAARLTAEDGKQRPSGAMVVRAQRYGSWKAACDAAGVPHGTKGGHTRLVRFTDDDLLEAIQRCARETGSTTYAGYEDWSAGDPGKPSAATIRNRLGRWSDIRRRAMAR